MDLGSSLALCAVLVALLVVAGLAVALALAVAARRRVEGELRAVRRDLGGLRHRLDQLAGPGTPVEPAGTRPAPATLTAPEEPAADFLITSLAGERPEPTAAVTSGQFASVALGESLVRVVSLAYGVRRALSPEQRNRIRFEMGREVKRSRRQRRRDLKDARRLLRRSPGGGHPVGTGAATGLGRNLAEDAA